MQDVQQTAPEMETRLVYTAVNSLSTPRKNYIKSCQVVSAGQGCSVSGHLQVHEEVAAGAADQAAAALDGRHVGAVE